jgi:hypothetical protein
LHLVGYILEYKLLEKHPLKIDGNSRISNTAVEHYRRMDLICTKKTPENPIKYYANSSRHVFDIFLLSFIRCGGTEDGCCLFFARLSGKSLVIGMLRDKTLANQ